jgi:malate dehydrogenase (oxaloacetate-decarboxylating)
VARLQPSASYSVTIRTENPHTPGMVGCISSAIGEAGGLIAAIDVVGVSKDRTVRDFVVAAADAAQEQTIVNHVKSVAGVRVISVSDRTFQLHFGGKIEVTSHHCVTSTHPPTKSRRFISGSPTRTRGKS